MMNRILLCIAIMAALYLLFKLNHVSQLRTAQRKAASISPPQQSQLFYFSSATCSQCAGQEKILKQIFNTTDCAGVNLNSYTIEDNISLAKQWGVKTLPTTILLSKTGKVKQINNGLVTTTELLSQLNELKTVNF